MPYISHDYCFVFHRPPAPGAAFRYDISESIEVTALNQHLGERLARKLLKLDSAWLVRECQDLGRWNRVA